MKTHLPKSYLTLIEKFPLQAVRSEHDCDVATKIIHQLALRDSKLDAGEEAYLEVLETLVEQYETHRHAINSRNVSPTRLLRMLVEQANMSVTELGKILGSKGAASELLSGRRKEASKAQIAKLCARFKVDASAFLLPADSTAHAA